MHPRPHQTQCLNDCMASIRKTVEPVVVEATVSFGKALTIAWLAEKIADISSKHVLILCPNGTLVKQNAKTVQRIGKPVSVFSASAGSKSLRHKIIVGTPQTIKNSLSRFDDKFAAILIDEGEGLTNAVIAICERIKDCNPNARIVGFTGTPFRTGTGYVYRLDIGGTPMPEDKCKHPFYMQLIHRTSTKDLMELGYLTPMVIGDISAPTYETSALQGARFNKAAIDQAYHGHGRLTAQIVADIVARTQGRNGVMIFAATVQHAQEIMASLPPELSRMVVGNNSKDENAQIIADFKAQRYKYIVNVDMLTVGFDAPHVDVIAMLRKTESARLLQQILGRGVRLCDDVWKDEPPTAELRKAAIAASSKPNCMLLDYTEDNAETHYPDGDLFNPVVLATVTDKENGYIHCTCPMCGGGNDFSARPNPDGYEHSADGYFLDLAGQQIQTEHGPIPAHFGRRCLNMVSLGGGKFDQCQQRWTCKKCPHCDADNDIAAKYCCQCKGELIDPNAKLVMEFAKLKRSPKERQCDEVLLWRVVDTISRGGNEMKRYDVTTPYRSFSVWVMCEPNNNLAASTKALFDTLQGGNPATITYKKQDDGFFRVYAFDQEKDAEP